MPADMSRDWSIIEECFTAALTTPVAEREAFIDRYLGEDTDAKARVMKLLSAHRDDQHFLDRGVISQAPLEPDIADIRIVRELGRGGMSRVFLGQREVIGGLQDVAVKQLHPHLCVPEITRRFEDEARILAQLNHPHIARLFDHGLDRHGFPYITMEYIDGQPVDQWCRENKQSLAQRLSLMSRICRAMAHAHAALIVHRDLKPANVLVDHIGNPKIVDFGIAKVLDDGRDATRSGHIPMTPDYASPEQRSGARLTIASDVYALGLILFKMLTGHHPARWVEAVGGRMRRDELAPSQCYTGIFRRSRLDTDQAGFPQSARRVAKRLSGEIDAVVLRCLAEDKANRYLSAEALADDLDALVEHRPTSVSNVPFRYRASRWLRRHRRTTAAATGVSAIALASMGVVIERNHMLENERSRAHAVADFLVDMFDAERLANQGLDVQQIKGLLDDALIADEPDDQLLHAEQLFAIGRAHFELGFYMDAARTLDKAKRIADSSDASPLLTVRIMRHLATVCLENGEPEDARTTFETASQLAESELGPTHRETAALRLAKARFHNALREPEEALAVLARIGPQHAEPEHRARSSLVKAEALAQTGRTDAALRLIESVLAANRVVEIDLQGDELAAGILTESGDYAAAEARYRLLLEKVADELGTLGWRWRWRVASGLAKTLALDERPSAGLAVLEEHLIYLESRAGPDHPSLVQMRSIEADLQNALGRPQDAEPLLRSIIRIERNRYGDRHEKVGWSMVRLGETLEHLSRFGEAIRIMHSALEILSEALGKDNVRLWEPWHAYGGALLTARNLDHAEVALSRALALVESWQGSNHPFAAGILKELSDVHFHRSDYAMALELLTRSRRVYEQTVGPDHVYSALVYFKIARVELARGQLAEAERSGQLALSTLTAASPEPLADWAILRARLVVARAQMQLDRPHEALETLAETTDETWRFYGLGDFVRRMTEEIQQQINHREA